MPVSKLLADLNEIVGEANLIGNPDQLKIYSVDGKRPKVLVSPGTIDEVSKIVAYANLNHLAIVPMGSGTKIGMGGIPRKVDLILSTGRLNRITDADCDNLTLSVESGIQLSEVQKSLTKVGRGYFLPLDPPFTEKATIGGIVATNSSGPRRLMYGTARDLIIGIRSVFSNGDIVVSGGKTVKNVSGYDMNKLMIGSFGTLGIICEVTFKLLPLPEKEATLWISFGSIGEANGFTREMVHSQLTPASMDILNATAVRKMKCSVPMLQAENYLVAVALEGVAESIERQVSEVSDRGKKHGALETVPVNSEKHRAFWIGVRDSAQGFAEADPNVISLRSNFLISKSGEMLESYERIARGMGMDCALICRSGSGILNTSVLVGKKLRSKSDILVRLVGELASEAVKNGGNLTVESCPLSIKKKVSVWGDPRSDYPIMSRLKKEMDPRGILNPGRFVGGI
ncbi:MAG: FAD-binding oxidoreductase [Thermodesulfobacteriota bacterium]